MHIKFNNTYLSHAGCSVAMVVANGVQGDSRVIKTAATLSKLGFRVHLFGMSKSNRDETRGGYPFSVELVKNPSFQMKAERVWQDRDGRRNIALFLELLVDGMAARISRRQFDILHTHDMYGLPIGAALTDKVFGSKTVWIHDLHEHVEGCTNIDEHIRGAMLEYERAHIRKPDALTTVSPILSEMIARQYDVVAPALVLNTPRMSDYDPWYPFPLRKKLDLNQGTPLMVYNGNVKPIRGVHFAVEALSLLPKVHLALITNSSGPYMDALINKAEALSVRDRLHVHPYVPPYEVTSFLRDVNAGVNPVTLYPNSDLALPNKIFEYIHSGTPVVSTATSALTDFLNANKCGVAFPEGNVEALAAGVQNVLERYPEGLPTVGQGSSLAAHYSWEAQEEVIGNLYARLLNRDKPSANLPSRQAGRIAHLPRSSANQPFTLAESISRQGGDAKCVTMRREGFGYKSHHCFSESPHSISAIQSYMIEQQIADYDTYHFHARPLIYRGDFSFPTGLDLVLLKAMGKAVYFHFRGSEIRLSSFFKMLTPYNYVDEQNKQSVAGMPFLFEEKRQVLFRDFILGVCDDCFVNDPELQCYVPNALIVPRAIDCNALNAANSVSENAIPLIVHAPSRRGVKGTDYIVGAVKQLKSEGYEFQFRMVENMPHSDAMAVYRQADIIIDQLRIGWYGVLAVEGMALGKAVVSYIRHDLRHYLPYPAPMAIANPDNITQVLRSLLENPDERRLFGQRGCEFVKSYHCADKMAKMLIELYERPVKPIDPVAVSTFLQYQLNPSRRMDRKMRGSFLHYAQEFRRASRNKGLGYAIRKAKEVLFALGRPRA